MSRLKLKFFIYTLFILNLDFFNPLKAQVLPDTTLPNNSVVNLNGKEIFISGGTNKSQNLFHSFERFDVPSGSTVFFKNSSVTNIFSRITGKSPSNINGLIKTNGNANLFLLNKNGIFFGPQAQLDIGGSFIATTADSILFNDGYEYNVDGSSLKPSLVITTPLGLRNGSSPGRILNRSLVKDPSGNTIGLKVKNGRSIGLFGGYVDFDGGHLSAPRGRIEVSGVGPFSLIDLQFSSPSSVFTNLQSVDTFRDIQLINKSSINSSSEGAGPIVISGRAIVLKNSSNIIADTFGIYNGGNIQINASHLKLDGGSFIGAATTGTGQGGNIFLNVKDLVDLQGTGLLNLQLANLGILLGFRSLSDRKLGGIVTGSTSEGKSGNISIKSKNLILRNGALVSAEALGPGDGGDIDVVASQVNLFRSRLATSSLVLGVPLVSFTGEVSGLSTTGIPSGRAGDINIKTTNLVLEDESSISASTTGDGSGGSITVDASFIELSEVDGFAFSPTTINALTVGGNGSGGDVLIRANRLVLKNGAEIVTNSGAPVGIGNNIPFGGNAGEINVVANEIEISGSVLSSAGNLIPSGLISATFSNSSAGEIKIKAKSLKLLRNSQISTSTSSNGSGGSITIYSELLELVGSHIDDQSPTGILSSSGSSFNPLATGSAGEIAITADRLYLTNGAEISVKSLNEANAGDLNIFAHKILLKSSNLTAATGSGQGGNIKLKAQNILQLRQSSQISAKSGGIGNGGNISIQSPIVLAFPNENSDIIANAIQGNGGDISITTQVLLGLEITNGPLDPFRSEINASSEIGIDGRLEINTPETDPTDGIVDLPTSLIDSLGLVSEACEVRSDSELNKLTITGRGGVPSSPREVLRQTSVVSEWNSHKNNTSLTSESTINDFHQGEEIFMSDVPDPIVEAQGWKINSEGKLVLTSELQHPNYQIAGLNQPTCP